MRLGPFTVDEQGGLQPSDPGAFPTFTVRWHDRVVKVRMLSHPEADATQGSLALTSILGRIPSTACPTDEAEAMAARKRAFGVLRGLPSSLPTSWHLALLADHRLDLVARVKLSLPVTASDLLTEVTMFLLELSPYLDLLDESGIFGLDAAGAEAGNANT
jgi:hypothetical protein